MPPGPSSDFAREIERLTRDTSHGIEGLKLSLGMENRSTAGQLGSLGRQISDITAAASELRSRSTHVVGIDGMFLQIQLPTNFQIATKVASFDVMPPPPSDDAERSAMVYLFGIGFNGDQSPERSSANVIVRVNGITSQAIAAPRNTSAPPGYVETLTLGVPVPVGNRFKVDMFVSASNGNASSKLITVGIDQAVAVVVYGGKV